MKSMKRVMKRIAEEMYATYQIAKKTSLNEALNTFYAKVQIQKSVRSGSYNNPRVVESLNKKHQTMLRYFQNDFSDYLRDYKYEKIVKENTQYEDNIWMCWWQGLENSPQIVKKCVESVQKHSGNHQLIIITEKNYKDFVSFPSWIIEKYRKGYITRTNLSDLLRLSLLAEYGGMWLDATFLCCSNEIQECFKYPIWSIKRPNYNNLSVANGYFAGYSIGCQNQYRWVFATVRDYFLHYWEKYDYLIDYLIIDYMIVLAQKNNPEIKELFSAIPSNNPRCDDLLYLMNKPFQQNEWDFLSKETFLFKLSWKMNLMESKDGELTYYHALLNNQIIDE